MISDYGNLALGAMGGTPNRDRGFATLTAPLYGPRMMRSLAIRCAVVWAGCGDNGLAVDAPGDGPWPAGVHIAGLSAPVDTYFDDNDIIHLRCASDADCYATQGYFDAAHRFFQMDLRRRVARGRLSEIIGALTLDVDQQARTLFTTRDGRPLEEVVWERLDARAQAAVAAYVRGVNAWLADARAGRNGAKFAPEYDFNVLWSDIAKATDWTELDSAACTLPLVQALTDSSSSEISMGATLAQFEPAVAAALFPMQPLTSSTILGDATLARTRQPQKHSAPDLRPWRDLLAHAATQVAPPRDTDATGSNSWVAGPSMVGEGAVLLANDPHLLLSNPALWHIVHLDSKSTGTGSLNVFGVAFAGFPGIVLGQNQHIAWGATTTTLDQADVYLEELTAGGTAVRFRGTDVPLITASYEIGVANGNPTPFEVRVVPHHGPIVATQGGAGVSVRWTGHDIEGDINALFDLAVATSVAEAKVAFERVTTLGQNFVVIDGAGRWGWYPFNRVPKRPWASPTQPNWLPLPGDGSAEWDTFYTVAEFPQADDTSGLPYLATANNVMTSAWLDGNPFNDGAPLHAFADPGFRHQRIVERLATAAAESVTEADMTELQGDHYSLVGARLAPAILAASTPSDSPAGAVRAAIAAWDYQCPTGLATDDPMGPPAEDSAVTMSARGCLAFQATFGQVRVALFADDTAGTNARAFDDATMWALQNPSGTYGGYWDNKTTPAIETPHDIVGRALANAAAILTTNLGAEPSDWLWGRLHTLTLRADLFDEFGVSTYNHPPVARDGGAYQVNVGSPTAETNGNFAMWAGASMRMVCRGERQAVTCSMQLPGGQNHDRSAPGYNSMLAGWLANQPTPMSMDIATLVAPVHVSVNPAP